MKHQSTAFGLAIALALAGTAVGQEQTGKLKFKEHKSFKFILPKDVWTPSAGGIRIAHPGGDKFGTRVKGVKMAVDTTGDGNLNAVVKGSKGFLRFTSKANGEKFYYAARFKGGNGKYEFQSSCSMAGSVGGVPIQLFDLNNNGKFGELGKDAMIVGNGKAACFVSRVVSHRGKLYELTVNEAGTEATVKPYEGDVGTLNVANGFKASGKLRSAIVSDGEGSSFSVGKGSHVVPVGEYTLVGGLVEKGSASVRIRAGKMAPIRVTKGETSKLKWGGPLQSEFEHSHNGAKVSVDPATCHYYGKAGEEYFGFLPKGKSPKFTVRDPSTLREVGKFIFDT